MLKHILKKIYFYSFIFVTVFFGGCGGGEHSDSFGISSLKNSLLNLVDSHSNNLTSIPSGGLYVFVTSYTNSSSVSPLTHNGNFARISGADAYCNSHIPSGLPGTGSYKAMLVDGINRVATTVGANSSSGQKDWVFEKNTSYYRPDGKLVFTTNDAGLFDFSTGSLSQAFSDSFYLWNLDRASIQLENCPIYATLFFRDSALDKRKFVRSRRDRICELRRWNFYIGGLYSLSVERSPGSEFSGKYGDGNSLCTGKAHYV